LYHFILKEMIRTNNQLRQEIMQAGYSPVCRHSEKCNNCTNCHRFDGVQIVDEEPKVSITLVGVMRYEHNSVGQALFVVTEVTLRRL